MKLGIVNTSLKEDIFRLLKQYWGFDSFRSHQEDIILSVLDGKDTLALLPTGGGKSLCFQLPGLALGGTTLVISPLIALMNDQVHHLRNKGISAVAINAAMNFKEIDIALNNAAMGHVQFLYISPERLQNENFRQKLSHLPITLIAVDEAHCISQWGYDFRPSYRKIAEFRSYFPGVNLVALTASATQFVVHDIQKQLQFKHENVIRQSFERKNLRYVVQLEENKIPRLLKIISNIGGSGLVYLRNRKKTEELARFLKQKKISSMAYHAGLKYDERQSIQQKWIENKIQVICATNAFGMGIDKADVRFVVHLDLPDSIEAYFQEAGRAGRDGKIAYSTIFFTQADQQRLLDNFKLVFPELDEIKQTYQAICNYYQVAIGAGEGLSIDFDLEAICKSYNLSPMLVYNSVKFLEKENYFSFLEGGYEPSKVLVNFNKEEIYQYEIRHPKFETLLKTLLRSYGGLFENYVPIHEKDLAYRVKLSAATVAEYLNILNKEEVLSYVPQSSLPKLVFMQDRVQVKFLEFNPENYHLLKERYLERIRAVIDYSNNNSICRQVQLLIYFNEHNFADCGHCDVCLLKRPKNYEKVKNKLMEAFEERPYSLDELHHKMRSSHDATWVKAFNEMIDDGIICECDAVYSLTKS
ncbi:MAG: RecQ family ATP-dependent DNA helicase [bacterium]|nr:RecQ family ATP-dependent DNA helicase [bacterium]